MTPINNIEVAGFQSMTNTFTAFSVPTGCNIGSKTLLAWGDSCLLSLLENPESIRGITSHPVNIGDAIVELNLQISVFDVTVTLLYTVLCL